MKNKTKTILLTLLIITFLLTIIVGTIIPVKNHTNTYRIGSLPIYILDANDKLDLTEKQLENIDLYLTITRDNLVERFATLVFWRKVTITNKIENQKNINTQMYFGEVRTFFDIKIGEVQVNSNFQF